MRTTKFLSHLGFFAAALCLSVGPSVAQDQESAQSVNRSRTEEVKSRSEELKAKRADDKRLNRISKTLEPVEGFESVEMFQAMESGVIEVIIKTKDSSECNIIVTNKSDKPLAIEMPAAFSAVPVLAQAGLAGGGGGMGGMGGGGMGGMGGGGGMGMGGGQGMGGGMGGGGGGGGFGGGGGMGGMGGGGMGGGGGGIFNIPPGRVGKVNVATFCLEHGKSEPRPQMTYKIQPLKELNDDPRVEKICRLLASGQIDQHVAQASAWNVANGLSWEFMLTKNRVERMDGSFERYFLPEHLRAAQQVVAWADTEVEADKLDSKSRSNDGSRTGSVGGR